MSGIGFDDLLQQAEQLTTGLDGTTELPRVQRNFQQLLDAGQRLCSKTGAGQDNAQIKASLLLSSQGADIPTIPDRLKSLTSVTQTFEPLEAVAETDIEGFLRNERENAILAVVEQQKQKSFDLVQKRHWESRLKDWESEKQQILNKLVESDGSLNFTQEIAELTNKTYHSKTAPTKINSRSSLEPWELAYVRQVHIYNDQVISGGLPLNLAEQCKSAAEKMSDVTLVALWKMVHYITQAPSFAVQSSSSVHARRTSKPVLEAFLNQARKYLEKSYVEYMQNCIYARPHIAQRGGVPGALQLVKSFLKLQPGTLFQSYEDGEVDGFPLWAVIFYCMRCGDLDAAADLIQRHEHLFPDFHAFFQEYVNSGERKLSAASEQKMRIQYKRVIRSSTDPYKIAVYCIVARCDVTNVHSEVAQKAEDYLWLKLCQVIVEAKSTAPADTLTLKGLQTLLSVDFGETHFNAASNPLLYYQVLFLTCQFEAALEFLSRFETLRCHAAHIALSLYSQEILMTSSQLHAKMLTSETAMESQLTIISKLNLPRLVMLYTRKFELTDPREALNYYYLLRDIRIDGESLLTHCVSEIVRETGEFEMLLGALNSDGSRKPGAIDKYCGSDTTDLIAKVAADTESKGLHEDAVRLYDLCGNYDHTLLLLNRILSPTVSASDALHPDRSRLKALALTIAERYRNLAVETSQSLLSTFHLQLDLISFFDLFHADRVEQALDVMRELQLLPVTNEQLQTKVTSFKSYSDEIRQNIGSILLATMSLLVKQYKQQQNLNKSLATKSRDAVCSSARQQGRALITFAGMLPYHLPGDVTTRLVQSEAMMN